MVRGPFWLRAVMERAIKSPQDARDISKQEITRMAQFTSCKGFPSPGLIKQGTSILEHRLTVTNSQPITDERLEVIELLSQRIGKRIGLKTAKRVLQNSEHVSLTNRSSYGSSRSKGGRATEVACHWKDWAIDKIDEPRFIDDCMVGDWFSEPNGITDGVVWLCELNHTTFELRAPTGHYASIKDWFEQGYPLVNGSGALFGECPVNDLIIGAMGEQQGFNYEDIPPDRRTIEWIYWGMFNFVDIHEVNWKRVIVRPLREAEDELNFEEAYNSVFFGENLAGYNGNVGVQVTQIAFRSLVAKGALKPYLVYNPEINDMRIICKANPKLDAEGNPLLWHSKMRTACKPETGGKARIFTIQEWDRTIALQPFGHFFVDCLKSLPEAEAGLSRENAGWEWANGLCKSGILKSLLQSFQVMTNDLDTATDFGEFSVGKSILKGVFKGISADRKECAMSLWWHAYLRSGAELLCSGVMIESPPA